MSTRVPTSCRGSALATCVGPVYHSQRSCRARHLGPAAIVERDVVDRASAPGTGGCPRRRPTRCRSSLLHRRPARRRRRSPRRRRPGSNQGAPIKAPALARSFSSSRSQSTISSDQPARRSRGQVELASADTDARGSACPIRKENVKAKLALRHTAYGELEGAPRQYAQKMVKTLSAYILSRFGSAATL